MISDQWVQKEPGGDLGEGERPQVLHWPSVTGFVSQRATIPFSFLFRQLGPPIFLFSDGGYTGSDVYASDTVNATLPPPALGVLKAKPLHAYVFLVF